MESVLDHLEELRKRLLISLAAMGIFSVVAYFFSGPLLDFLSLPFHRIGGIPLYFHSPYEAFLAHLKVSFLAGVMAASPVLFTELWLFVVLGLVRLRILSVERLKRSRRIVIALVLIVATVLTPSLDPVSQLLLAIPLLLLYEGCLWEAERIERKRDVTMITDSRTRTV